MYSLPPAGSEHTPLLHSDCGVGLSATAAGPETTPAATMAAKTGLFNIDVISFSFLRSSNSTVPRSQDLQTLNKFSVRHLTSTPSSEILAMCGDTILTLTNLLPQLPLKDTLFHISPRLAPFDATHSHTVHQGISLTLARTSPFPRLAQWNWLFLEAIPAQPRTPHTDHTTTTSV